MANLVVSGDTSGSVTITAPAIAGSPVATLPSSTGTLALTSQVYGSATQTSGGSNIVLTSSSNRVQNVSMTAADKSVSLPDATTMELGGPHFTIYNKGPYSFEIKTNGGYSIAYSNPGDTYEFSLISKSTVNGLWIDTYRGAARLGYATSAAPNLTYYWSAQRPARNETIYSCALTQDKILITWSSALNVTSAVIGTISGTSWTFGSIVTVSSTTSRPLSCVALTDSTGFIYVEEGSVQYLFPFSVSGTTITIGTKSADATDHVRRPIRLSNNTAIASGPAGLRVAYYNGTSAPTLGTALNTGTSSAADYDMINSTSGIQVGVDPDVTEVNPFSVSNITVTAGTLFVLDNNIQVDGSFVNCAQDGTTSIDVYYKALPNLGNVYTYEVASVVGTGSGSTFSRQTVKQRNAFDIGLIGSRIMASNTSGIYVSTKSVGLQNESTTEPIDFSLIIPQNLQPVYGFSQDGIPYRDPRYTIYDAANASSTRYIIISTNAQFAAAANGFFSANTAISNGTTWYLTIADEMS